MKNHIKRLIWQCVEKNVKETEKYFTYNQRMKRDAFLSLKKNLEAGDLTEKDLQDYLKES